MPMKPHKDESQSDFMARCVPEMIGTGDDKRPQDQAVAICYDIWRNRDKSCTGKAMVDPADYEDEEDFMGDCVDELGDEDVCQIIWDNAGFQPQAIKHKTHDGKVAGMEFILSDETPDRMDDVIMSDGWDLKAFKKNPIALFNHRSDFPIGKWHDLRVEDKALKGLLELAPSGTSERVDEIRRLVDAGILKAVSVGFKPIEVEDREGTSWGYVYHKCELVETSLVAVPANPNALAVAKSLKISPETMNLVFAGQGKRDGTKRRGFNGGHAKSNRNVRGRTMSTLAQRITTLEEQINSRRDALNDHLDKMDDTNVSNSDLEITNKFNQDIAQLTKTREMLIESEKNLAATTDEAPPHRSLVVANSKGNGHDRSTKPEAPSVISNRHKDSVDFLELFVKAGTLAYVAKANGSTLEAARAKISEKHPEYKDEATRLIADLVLRAASAPALTTVAGWAQELVQTTWAGLMPLLMPQSILPRLSTRGLSLSFGPYGKIVIPTRSRTPSLAGSFVGEGAPIPVRQGAFTSQTLTPKKMAVITTWTKEMDDHSIPAIEGLLREAIQQDTSVAIDTVLIDANAATTIRPAGLLNGVSVTTATAGGGLAALVGDIVGLINAISAATYGNVRNLVWLANQTDMLRASLLSAANTGIFPFRDEIRGGTLGGIPIIDSATVTAKTLILVDAADFVSVGGDAPRMEMSDQATLHMEDTTPLELVASPSTVAAPQRSLFQTDSLALRMVLPLNWVQRRAGTVAYTQNVTW
jgi:HK97 family phage prohead protease/HK97 family phage major capsid protein